MQSAPTAGTLSRCKIGLKKRGMEKECKTFTLFLLDVETMLNFAARNDQ